MRYVPLSQVCKIVNGGTPKSSVADFWSGDVAWLTPAEMGKLKAPEIADTARTISAIGLKNCSAKQVPAHSVIMSTRAPIGHLAIPLVPMAFNQGCRGLVPNETLDTKYLYHFLWYSRESLNELGTGTTFKELSTGALGAFKIPLPPIDEQRVIVARLDDVFAAIATATANAEKNLANAQALFAARLKGVFSNKSSDWRDKAIGQIADVGYGYTEKASFAPVGPKFLRITDIQNGEVLWNSVPNCPISEKDYQRQRLRTGDIVFARTGATTGKSLLIEEPPEAVAASYLIRLRVADPEVEPAFVQFFFQTPQYWSLVRAGTSGSAQGGFNASKLEDMHIPVPTLTQQRKAVNDLSTMNEQTRVLGRVYQAKIASLAALKQSFLKHAFSGELTPPKRELVPA